MSNRKRMIEAMHAGGMTYDEIGQALGISRQAAHQMVNRKKSKNFHEATVMKIPYIGLREWMLENRVSVRELTRRCETKTLILDGSHNLRADKVGKILEVTGLKFSDCFRRDD